MKNSPLLLFRCVLQPGEVTVPVDIDRNELRRAPAAWLADIVLGFIFGFASALVGLDASWAPLGGGLLGLAAGLCLFYVYVWWLLSPRLGRFRLQLVAAS